MEFLFTFFSLFGCSLFWFVPTALTAAAIVDILRVRAEWYWICVVLMFPVFGSLGYFAVYYLPIFGSRRGLGQLSPTAARRAEARRRLREIKIQLQHWRGPALLADAGSQLLALGRTKDAEALLREAKGAGADVKDVNFDLAQVLQVRSKSWSEAAPLLDELLEVDADARFGSARLGLARCLDEAGDKERAEEVLRQVLAKRDTPEAKVRLARILLGKGEGQEAARWLGEVRTEAQTLPKYLRRQHGAWIRAARRLRGAETKLPKPRLEGVPPRRALWLTLSIGLGVLLVAAAGVGSCVQQYQEIVDSQGSYEEIYQLEQDRTERLEQLEESHPAPESWDDEGWRPADHLDPFLAVRRELTEPCAEVVESHQSYLELQQRVEGGDFGIADGFSMVRQTTAWSKTQAQFGLHVAEALAAHEMGPRTFERLLYRADAELLGRDAARVFGMPGHFRADYAEARYDLEQDLPPRTQPDWRREVQRMKTEAEAKLADLEAHHPAPLDDETAAAFEARRGTLDESLDAACVEMVVHQLAPDLPRPGTPNDWYGY